MVTSDRLPYAEKVCKEALKSWGSAAQYVMLMEECAEVIQATSKVLRKPNSDTLDHLAGELADLQIMIDQMEVLLSTESVPFTEMFDYPVTLKTFYELKMENLYNKLFIPSNFERIDAGGARHICPRCMKEAKTDEKGMYYCLDCKKRWW
jgi:hypothetical protein